MLIKRAGLAMGIFFLYMIIEQFVVGIGRNKYKVTWVDYLPEEVSDRLIPQPFTRRMVSNADTQCLGKTCSFVSFVSYSVYFHLYIYS